MIKKIIITVVVALVLGYPLYQTIRIGNEYDRITQEIREIQIEWDTLFIQAETELNTHYDSNHDALQGAMRYNLILEKMINNQYRLIKVKQDLMNLMDSFWY